MRYLCIFSQQSNQQFPAWVNSTQCYPALLSYQLINITDLVSDSNKRENIQTFISSYAHSAAYEQGMTLRVVLLRYSHETNAEPVVRASVEGEPFNEYMDNTCLPWQAFFNGGPLFHDCHGLFWDENVRLVAKKDQLPLQIVSNEMRTDKLIDMYCNAELPVSELPGKPMLSACMAARSPGFQHFPLQVGSHCSAVLKRP